MPRWFPVYVKVPKSKTWCGICMVESDCWNGFYVSIWSWKVDSRMCLTVERWRINLVLQFQSIFWDQWSNWAFPWFSWLVCLWERVHVIPLAKLSADVCVNTAKKSNPSVGIVSYAGASKLHNWNVRRRKEFEIYSHSGCNKDLFFASPSCDNF